MPLIKELKIQNIVILANNFNPSVINHHWLITNKLLSESDILPNSLFASNGIQLSTEKFNLIVLPDQLQLNIINSKDGVEVVNMFLLPLVDKIQGTPFRACGINFNWFISDSDKNIHSLSKEYFYNKNLSFINDFNDDTSKYGVYLSKDFNGSRLKLDIKPISARKVDEPLTSDYIQLAFNFHKDLHVEKFHQELIDFLAKFNIYFSESENITNKL